MKKYCCEKCGSIDVFIDNIGSQNALICGDCGSWLKWIGKKELPLVECYISSINVEETEINMFKMMLNESIQKLGLNKDKVIEIVNSLYKD